MPPLPASLSFSNVSTWTTAAGLEIPACSFLKIFVSNYDHTRHDSNVSLTNVIVLESVSPLTTLKRVSLDMTLVVQVSTDTSSAIRQSVRKTDVLLSYSLLREGNATYIIVSNRFMRYNAHLCSYAQQCTLRFFL